MFRFDFPSFVIGLIVGLLIAALLYRQRAGVGRAFTAVRDRARAMRDSLTANLESRYRAALQMRLDRLNLTQSHADFERVFLLPRFDAPSPRPSLNPIDPATLTPLSVSAALRSTTRLVVLGASGSGRTTLLSKIARVHLDQQAVATFGLTAERLPIYLHLAEIDWANASDTDPLAALLPAATAHVPRLVASNVGKMLGNRLRAKVALLLLDGFDELPATARTRCAAWLGALLNQFPDVPLIITAGTLGYGPLHALGCAPLTLAAWSQREVEQYAQRWIDLVSGGAQDQQMLSAGLWQIDDLTPLPIDLAVAVGVWRAANALPPTRLAAYDQWLDQAIRRNATKELLAVDRVKAALGQLAWVNFQTDRLDLTFDEITSALAAAIPVAPDAAGKPVDSARLNEQAAEIAHDLIERTQILLPFGLDGWTFTHRHVAAYLAAWHAVQIGAPTEMYWDQPDWTSVFDFYAALTDPAALVTRNLTAEDNLSRERLWTAARWTGAASPDAPWRSKVLGEVARALLQPDQFSVLRERAMFSLLATHDKGLGFLFKRAVTHTEPHVRVLSLRALARLNREADLPSFNAALNDQVVEVRLEAIRGIGALASHGSNAAQDLLIRMMLDREEAERQLVAECLADCGAEGHQILREAAAEEDIKIRRAAAYGLAATGQDWARDLLKKLERDDKQWFVRSAATDALSIMQARSRKPTDDPALDLSPLVIDQQGWLVEWAAQQGIGIGVGRQANAALLRALAEGQPPVRLAAIRTLQHTGDLSHHDTLRALLHDPDRTVREAAFAALEAIGQRTGQPLPR